jgi:hypothetical protein
MSNLYTYPSIDASYHVSVHLAKQFRRRIICLIDQPETRIAYGGYVCWFIGTKWATFIEDFHRCVIACFCSFGQAVLEEKFLEIDQPETRIAYADRNAKNNLYRRSSRDVSYQVSIIWESGFRGED